MQKNGDVVLDDVPVLYLEPTKGWVSLRLQDLWRYRELLYFLAWRDIKIRYKQTILGGLWAIAQPLLTMVVFTLFFGRLAKMPSDGIPYPIFSYAALEPWAFFSGGVTKASNSLVGSANLLKKVYFPRLAMPIAAVVAGLVDFILAFIVLLLLMLYFGIVPTINVIWLPLLVLLAFASCLGISFWFAAMNVQFRDVRHTVPFIIQTWMFATPVAYPSSLIQDEFWRAVYALNPMVGVVEGFRWALLGVDTAPGAQILVSGVAALTLLVSGAFYFRRMERVFADVV